MRVRDQPRTVDEGKAGERTDGGAMTEDMTCREFAKLLKTHDAHYPLSDRYVNEIHDSPDKSGNDEREHMIIWFEANDKTGTDGALLSQHPEHERAALLRAVGERGIAPVDSGGGGRAHRNGAARLRRRCRGGQLPPRLRRDTRDHPLERDLHASDEAAAVGARGRTLPFQQRSPRIEAGAQ